MFEFLSDLAFINGYGHSYYCMIARELAAAMLYSEVFESNFSVRLRV
jgi:hypothetical protein